MKTSASTGAPLSTKAIGVLVLIVILGMLVFAMTEARWYDHLEPKEKVAFWTDTCVAGGTLALAVVTWVSVVGTQDIVKNEDLRFRQSRMPLVKIFESNYGEGLYWITLLNIGDGPAKNVYGDITASYTVRTKLTDESTVDHVRHYEGKSKFMVSYLPATKACKVSFEVASESGKKYAGGLIAQDEYCSILHAVIRYKDMFGGDFITDHMVQASGGFNSDRFEWVVAPELLRNSTIV